MEEESKFSNEIKAEEFIRESNEALQVSETRNNDEMVYEENKCSINDWNSLVWLCYHCGKGFNAYANLKDHNKSCHRELCEEEEHFICFDCEEPFLGYSLFLNHIRNRHYDSLKLCCDVCNDVLPDFERLAEHREEHMEFSDEIHPNVFHCTLCEKVFSTELLFKLHIQDSHNILMFLRYEDDNSKDTGLKSESIDEPDEELLSMEEIQFKDEYAEYEEIFQCGKCVQNFKSESSLKVHMESHNRKQFKYGSALKFINTNAAQTNPEVCNNRAMVTATTYNYAADAEKRKRLAENQRACRQRKKQLRLQKEQDELESISITKTIRNNFDNSVSTNVNATTATALNYAEDAEKRKRLAEKQRAYRQQLAEETREMAGEIPFEFISGFRKNSVLLYTPEEKQLYRQINVYDHGKRYACYDKNCNVSVFLDNQNKCRRLKEGASHAHPTQDGLVTKMRVANDIKEKCLNATLKRNSIREIFNGVVQENQNAANMIHYGKMRRHLCRIKSEALPKTPSSPEELRAIFENKEMLERFGTSKYSKHKFYQCSIIEENFSYSIFMSADIKNIINENEEIPRKFLMDGTFSVVPSCGFKQLLIIFVEYCGHVYPFIYVLMNRKMENIYVHLFQFIDANIFKFKAASVMTDYEKALRNALSKVFPFAELNGCWFHYCQELKRNAIKIPEFMKSVRADGNLKRIYYKFLALPLMKPEHIIVAFEKLKTEALNIPSSGKCGDAVSEFLRYYESQWMTKEGPNKISVNHLSMRTTSALEGYNSQLSNKMAKNGNFFKFLDTLLDDEFKKIAELKNTLDGTLNVFQQPKSSKVKNRFVIIENLISQLNKGKLTIQHFLNQVTNSQNELISDFGEEDHEIINDVEEEPETLIPQSDIINPLLCIICMEKEKNILLQPCNHVKTEAVPRGWLEELKPPVNTLKILNIAHT